MAFYFYIPEKPIAEMLMRACEMHLVKKVKTGKDNEKDFFFICSDFEAFFVVGGKDI